MKSRDSYHQDPGFRKRKGANDVNCPCSWTHSVEQCRVWARAQDLVLL